jgi:hypothetical protein
VSLVAKSSVQIYLKYVLLCHYQGLRRMMMVMMVVILTSWNRGFLKNWSFRRLRYFLLMWNPKIHYLVPKIPSADPIAGLLNPVHILTPYFFNVYFNVINLSRLRFYKTFLPV